CACSMPCRPTSFAPASGRRAKRRFTSKPSLGSDLDPSACRIRRVRRSLRPAAFLVRNDVLQEPTFMSLDALIDTMPPSAKDLKLNYSSLVRNNSELTPQQLWGTVVATAIATRNAALTSAAISEAGTHLTPAGL